MATTITKDNFIVVYNLDSLDSLSFATYYAEARELRVSSDDPSISSGSIGGVDWQVNGRLLGIQCSTTEIFSSELDFNTYVLNPIKDALDNAEEFQNTFVGGIVLGYKVPGGFYDVTIPISVAIDLVDVVSIPFSQNPIEAYSGNNIISATSRISRINHNFNEGVENKLYNRNVFKRLDSDDITHALICSRIDGPNLQFVKKTIDKATILYKQLFANGKFYIDPYSDRHATGAEDYTNLLLDFKDNMLPILNLPTWETTFQDPYIDPTIPFIEDDSFVWSWFSNRASTSFFQNSNATRVFFYNADYDGGFTIRDENGKTWPFLALDGNYILTAGSMSNPTIDGFLNPNAFFYSLLRGATLGEAFLYSVPYLDWTVSLFGDPIPFCSFSPTEEIGDDDVIGEYIVWEKMSKDLAITAANLYKKELELKEVVNEVVDIKSEGSSFAPLDLVLTLLYPSNDLHNQNKEVVWKGQLKALVNKLFDFPTFEYFYGSKQTQAPSINDYLTDNGFKISRLLAEISQDTEPIKEENLLDEGWWQFEFVLNDDDPDNFVNYHFVLEVSDDEDFDNIFLTKDSISIRNWTYEDNKEEFVNFDFSGVSSSYIGRKVRYESKLDSLLSINEYLTRGETHYFRVTQYNLETSVQYLSREYSDIIYT